MFFSLGKAEGSIGGEIVLQVLKVVCANCFFISTSVQTEAEFCPPAGAGAPAHKLQGSPAGDEAPVTPLLHPKAPVTPEPLVITGGLKSS